MNRCLVLGLGLFLISFVVGCSGDVGPELVSVKGVVQINKQPASGIMVRFMPNVIDESIQLPSSQAITNENGEFELFTDDNKPGVAKGPHKVSLIDTLEERVPQGQAATQKPRLSSKYSRAGSIEITIDGDDDNLVIEAKGP